MIYAVGDIHGKYTMLTTLLDGLPLTDADTLVFVGDYIDRGEDSRAVIDFMLELRKQRGENVIFLRGNHEQMILDAQDKSVPPNLSGDERFALFDEPTLLWLQNGGGDTLASYDVESPLRWRDAIPESHWEFFRATQMEYITEDYHFVHAGIALPNQRWDGMEQGLDARLWIREPFLASRADYGGKRVVFGHTPQMSGKPLVLRNKIGIDTGAVFGGPLTAAALDPETANKRGAVEFYQAAPPRSR